MDYAKCWMCGPPHPLYLVVMALIVFGLLFAVWKAMRPPRAPKWSLTGKTRRRG